VICGPRLRVQALARGDQTYCDRLDASDMLTLCVMVELPRAQGKKALSSAPDVTVAAFWIQLSNDV
jgi:hypothetical protein